MKRFLIGLLAFFLASPAFAQQGTIISGATFTTPAGTTAYASNDLIANSATAGSVVPMTFANVCRVPGGTGMVRRARFKTTDTGFAGQSVKLALYKSLPTVTNGDNGAWLSPDSEFIGTISVTASYHFSDYEKGIGAPDAGSEINFDCATGSQSIYGLEIAGGAITPVGAQTHAWILETLPTP